MRLELTAVFHEAEEGGFVAQVKEIPGAISQGETLEEARANLEDALRLLIETSRMIADGEIISSFESTPNRRATCSFN
jgi:predicted RNase H-like HicB family nuclease